MDDYVPKPLDLRILLGVLDRWMEPSETEELQPTRIEEPTNPPPQFVTAPVEPSLPHSDELPMDVERALERFGNDRPFLYEMSRDYMAGFPERIKDLRTALDTHNANDFSRHAHNLKGVSANFSAIPVTNLCAEMEALGRQDDLTSASILVERLEVEKDRLEKYLNDLGILT
jgi:two-component system sensor histidine kinase/response regulator